MLVEREKGLLMPKKRSAAMVAPSNKGHCPKKTMAKPIKLQRWQAGSTSIQLKLIKWYGTTTEAVTSRPMKSVTTKPQRKTRKEERERLCIFREELTSTQKAKRLEQRPMRPKAVENHGEERCLSRVRLTSAKEPSWRGWLLKQDPRLLERLAFLRSILRNHRVQSP